MELDSPPRSLAGGRVLVTGLTKAGPDEAGEELGENEMVAERDAASPPDINQLADRVESEFGTLDLPFVNAGTACFMRFESVTEAAYDELFSLNTKGAYFTVRKLVPLIPIMSKGSAVVFATSTANVKGLPLNNAYPASKATLDSVARCRASELLPHGIRVNAVSRVP